MRALSVSAMESLIVHKAVAGNTLDSVGQFGRCSLTTCQLHEDDSLAI